MPLLHTGHSKVSALILLCIMLQHTTYVTLRSYVLISNSKICTTALRGVYILHTTSTESYNVSYFKKSEPTTVSSYGQGSNLFVEATSRPVQCMHVTGPSNSINQLIHRYRIYSNVHVTGPSNKRQSVIIRYII